jgi:hypothetical protein
VEEGKVCLDAGLVKPSFLQEVLILGMAHIGEVGVEKEHEGAAGHD